MLRGPSPELFPGDPKAPAAPLPGFLTAERRRVWAFDEMHHVDASVHRPQSVAELQGMIQAAAKTQRKVTVRGGGRSLGQQSLGRPSS